MASYVSDGQAGQHARIALTHTQMYARRTEILCRRLKRERGIVRCRVAFRYDHLRFNLCSKIDLLFFSPSQAMTPVCLKEGILHHASMHACIHRIECMPAWWQDDEQSQSFFFFLQVQYLLLTD